MKRFLGLVVSAALPAASSAADASITPKPWKDSAEASVVTTNGNSKATTESIKNLFSYSFDPVTSLDIDAGALSSKNQNQLVAEQFFAGEKLARKWNGRDYGFESYRWERNVFAGIRHRHAISLGAGRELVKTETDFLDAEAGPAHVIEERVGENRRSFGAARVFSKCGHDFSAAVKFQQTIEYVQSLKDGRDNRFNAETSFVSTLSSVFSLKVSFLWQHVSQPPPNAVKDDTTTSVALIANF